MQVPTDLAPVVEEVAAGGWKLTSPPAPSIWRKIVEVRGVGEEWRRKTAEALEADKEAGVIHPKVKALGIKSPFTWDEVRPCSNQDPNRRPNGDGTALLEDLDRDTDGGDTAPDEQAAAVKRKGKGDPVFVLSPPRVARHRRRLANRTRKG